MGTDRFGSFVVTDGIKIGREQTHSGDFDLWLPRAGGASTNFPTVSLDEMDKR